MNNKEQKVETSTETLPFAKLAVMSSAIAFAEWVDWNKYERFEGRRDLWYDKKSSYTNPLPIKTTKDLWNEFVKHCS
jgi:hypothetical protein